MVRKKKNEETALAPKEETALANPSEELSKMYEEEDVSGDDILISRVLLMQGQSKLVEEEKASPGQIVGSLEADVLAKSGETIEIIPFHRHKSFRLFKDQPGGGKPLFVKEVPYDVKTAQWEKNKVREVEEDGEKLMCFITWNYYVLLANQIEGLPRMLSFSSTNFKMGKKLTTFTVEAKKAGLQLPFKTYKIGCEKTKNEKGNWFIYTVDKGRKTEDEELKHVTYWAKMAKSGAVKVDENIEETYVSEGEQRVERGEMKEGDEF
jgi:hypothetical protein